MQYRSQLTKLAYSVGLVLAPFFAVAWLVTLKVALLDYNSHY